MLTILRMIFCRCLNFRVVFNYAKGTITKIEVVLIKF